MNHMASREFQLNYQRLDEPVLVSARSRTLGAWYPTGTEPAYGVQPIDPRLAQLEQEVVYLKKQLSARLTTKVEPIHTNAISEQPWHEVSPGFNTRPFTPAPKEK